MSLFQSSEFIVDPGGFITKFFGYFTLYVHVYSFCIGTFSAIFIDVSAGVSAQHVVVCKSTGLMVDCSHLISVNCGGRPVT